MNIWNYFISFLIGGFICFLAQILVIRTKITTARILVLFLIIGMVLELLNIYAPFKEFAKAGASVPIIGFGASLARGAIMAAKEYGFIELDGSKSKDEIHNIIKENVEKLLDNFSLDL